MGDIDNKNQKQVMIMKPYSKKYFNQLEIEAMYVALTSSAPCEKCGFPVIRPYVCRNCYQNENDQKHLDKNIEKD